MAAKFNYYTKKIHRYLGVFIGIQFLLWTLGGFYFSWTDINEIRGDHLRAEGEAPAIKGELASPSVATAELVGSGKAAEVTGLRLSHLLETPIYELSYRDQQGAARTAIADARTGGLLKPIGRDQAVTIANVALSEPGQVSGVLLLTQDDIGGHHEYRDKPLPVWAVSYREPENLVVYVAQDTGRVESLRTSSWRVFDFFWLFHTLDLYGRDNINNYVLRAFSVLGLITIFSGYLLFFITSPWFRKGRVGNNSD